MRYVRASEGSNEIRIDGLGKRTHTSPFHSRGTPGLFYTYFYNHAHRLRLEKLLYIELSRSSNGFFKVLLYPGGGLPSETAARRLQM
jgi:hypothetical protein